MSEDCVCIHARYVPEKVVTNDDLSCIVGYQRRVDPAPAPAVGERHFSGGETAVDLCVGAGPSGLWSAPVLRRRSCRMHRGPPAPLTTPSLQRLPGAGRAGTA